MTKRSSGCPYKSSLPFKRYGYWAARNVKLQFIFCCIWHAAAERMYRLTWFFLLAASSLSAGCGTIQPTHANGRHVSIEHGLARFPAALKSAQDYCARQGLAVKHVGTDTPYLAISRFECIQK